MAELAPESNVSAPDSITRWIPTKNLPKLRTAVELLAKRAAKLGVPPITMVEGATEPRDLKVEILDDWQPTGEFNTIIIDQTEVTLRGKGPVLPGGFEFLAKIEHLASGKNVVSAVPGHTVPPKFRTAPPDCDHCRTKRDRRDTFVVIDPNKVTRQIGRTCLVDYMGQPGAEKLASLAAELGYFFADVDKGAYDGVGEGEGGGGGGRGTYEKTLIFLASVVDTIAEHGFAKSDAELPTFVRADDRLHPSPRSGQPVIWPTDAAIERAKKIIAWGDLIPADVKTEYLWNLKVLLAEEYLPYRSFAIVASAPVAYARALGEDVGGGGARFKPKAASAYVGQVGDRTRLKLHLERSIELKSDAFDDAFLHMLRTEQGDVAVWKTQTGLGIEGTDHDLICTIAAHKDYKGIKQTILKRCVPFAEKVKVEPTAEDLAAKKAEKATLPWRKTIQAYDSVLGYTAYGLGFGRYVREPETAAERKAEKRVATARDMIASGGMEWATSPAGGVDILVPSEKGASEITRAMLELVDVDQVHLVNLSEGSRFMVWWEKNRGDLALNDYHPPAGWKLTPAGRIELDRMRAADAPAPAKRGKKAPAKAPPTPAAPVAKKSLIEQQREDAERVLTMYRTRLQEAEAARDVHPRDSSAWKDADWESVSRARKALREYEAAAASIGVRQENPLY
jgi:hypothetical protein